MMMQMRPEGDLTANFLGFLQSASVPPCSLLILGRRTGKVLLQKLQLLVVCIILISFKATITEQGSKPSPLPPPNKAM